MSPEAIACPHAHVEVHSRLYAAATREMPAEYEHKAQCQDCGQWMDVEDIPEQVTPEGWAWKAPESRPRVQVPRHPCGHPIVESTPKFCLKCRNASRWDAIDGESRYYIPTMSQALGR